MARAEPYLHAKFHLDPSNRLATVHERYREDRTDNGPIAYGEPFKTVAQKTLSGKVVAQSIAFRVVSIYWQGDDPFSLKSWLLATYPLLKAASFDTFCHTAPQP